MLFGRCPRCGDVAELFHANAVKCLCKHCIRTTERNSRLQNHGRPELPHDKNDVQLVYQVDRVYSQL